MQKRIYFGHPVNTYGTDLEKKLLRKISQFFHDWDVENPNHKIHQDGYGRWQKTMGNGMNYFFNEVLPDCHGGIFLLFRDGKWGAGTFGEAKFLLSRKYPIYLITANGEITKTDLAAAQVLSVEETRLRVRTSSGKTVPY